MGKPQVAYRETIRETVNQKVSLFVRPVAAASTARCLRSNLEKRVTDYEFVDEIVVVSYPGNIFRSRKGYQEQLRTACWLDIRSVV